MEKLQKIKRKVTLLITDGNTTKKQQNNGKTSTNEKSKNDPKLEKELTG